MIHQFLLVAGKEEEEARWTVGQETPWKGDWTQIFAIINNIANTFKNGGWHLAVYVRSS